jgi:Raf kinase inhibitor-like YbhB/YbcL family protein
MPNKLKPPLPYDFLPEVPAFTVTSVDIADGKMLTKAQLFNGLGVSGDNLSPNLSWSGFPSETQSFAITCFDPDAPTGSGFWHWVLFDVPATVTSLPTGAGSNDMAGLPEHAIHARNDFGTKDFAGAAPPIGDSEHRYVFAVHALDVESLGLDSDASPAFVGFNITFHTIARGLIVPVYAR